MKKHFCVWIDRTQAKIIGVGLDGTDEAVVASHHAKEHAHHADHGKHSQSPMDQEFLHSIGEALLPARGILVVGPGRAKTDLMAYLKEHLPAVAKNVWAMEAMDHPTDAELVAAARQYFKTATHVHG